MKNKHILIMLLATALLFGATACHKDAQLEPKTPKVSEPDVSFTATTANFGWTVSFPGKVSSVVKVSRHADMSDATSYGDATLTSNKDFHVEITGLSPETQYYYCFEIWNPNLNHRSEVKSFTTLTVTKPSVSTSTATDISWTTATAGGNVTDDGNDVVLERGVCWGTSHNPDTGSDFSHLAASSAGTGEYSCTLTGLAHSTKYYVRAYATNNQGTSYGDEKDFTTQALQKPTVTTASVSQFDFTNATAVGGGEVTSDGGDAVTERGIYFGTTPNPAATGTKLVASSAGTGSFTCTMTGLVEETTYYVCAYATNSLGTGFGSEVSFTTQQTTTYTITVSASPTNGGTVSGGGTYQQGQSCTVHATANSGYVFTNWTEGGSQVSTNANYTFTVTGNRTLVAHFTYNGGGGNAPTGAINGLFTINSNGDQVYFSQGNLQYKASTNTWRFAENQWDYVGTQNPPGGNPGGTVSGSDNSNISQTYSGWIDLFGWGTSGYNHGAVCYQPWSKSPTFSDYYAYGQETYNLYDQTGQADWGYNAISNGGNQANQWRTLTTDEWAYVFNNRTTSSGIRYAKANVNNVNGVILLPDDWSSDTYSFTNTDNASCFSSNVITTSQWNTLEQAGAVFLPAAGYRSGSSVGNVGSGGYYWSASRDDSNSAYNVRFFDSGLDPQTRSYRYAGHSVRLVRNVQ